MGVRIRRRETKTRLVCLQCLAAFLLISCGGSGGDSENDPASNDSGAPQTATGFFKDSAVEGLSYVSGAQSGVTGADGSFIYKTGENVTFTIGGVTLGTATGKAVVTPIDLVPGGSSAHTEVQNIVRFLLMIDSDGDPSNGILISPAVSTIAQTWTQVDFGATDLNAELVTIISDAASVDGVAHSLPGSSAARTHLEETFRCVYSGIYRGTFSGGDSGHFGAWISPEDGGVAAVALNPNTQAGGTISGSVPISIDSDVAFVSGNGPGITFSGNLTSPDHVEGNWDYAAFGISGTFSGNRIGESAASDIVYRFSGMYSGASFTSADIGFYAINVDASDNLTGIAYSAVTNEQFTLTGTLTGVDVTATASNGTTITGTLNKTTGFMFGDFDNPASNVTGSYVGNGCKLN